MSRWVDLKFEDPAGFKRLADNLGRTQFIRYLRGVLIREGKLWVAHIRRTQFKGGPTTIDRRSGLLAESLDSQVTIQRNIPTVRVGVFEGDALNYAAMQEYGTKDLSPDSPFNPILPRKGKALAFPVPRGGAANPDGTSKYRSPRDFPGKLKFVPVKKGSVVGLLVKVIDYRRRRPGTSRTINVQRAQVVYLLLSKVSLRAGRFLRRGAEQYAPRLSQNLSLAIADYIERA